MDIFWTAHKPNVTRNGGTRKKHHVDNNYPLIYMTLLALFCCIFKPIKICISGFTLGKQAKHHACEPAYHLG